MNYVYNIFKVKQTLNKTEQLKTKNKTNMIKIDKNIPMPDKYVETDFPSLYKQMQVGDSFLYSKTYNYKLTSKSSAMNSWYGKKLKRKFVIAKYKKGIRVWRVK